MIKYATLYLGLCFYASGMAGNDAPTASKKELTPQSKLTHRRWDRNLCAYAAGFFFLPMAVLFRGTGPLVSISIATAISSMFGQASYAFHKDVEKFSQEMQPPVPFNIKRSWAEMAVNGAMGLGSFAAIIVMPFL